MSTFVRVVEAGSFTAAAERMELVKSAVSRRISDLEARLGIQLFHRTTRRLTLTDTGRGFYERCVRVLADLEEAEQSASQAHGALHGRLRMAVPLAFGLRHLAPALVDFARQHPRVEFDLDFNDRRVDLIEDGFDLALRIGKLEDSTLMARRLAPINTVLCASPEYLAAHGTPGSPDELARHALLGYTNVADPDLLTCWDAGGTRHRVRVPLVLRANSGDFLLEAAIGGKGLVLSPTFIAWEAVARGDVVPVLTEFSWPRSAAYAVYPPTRFLSQRVRVLVDFLAERFAGTPYWDAACEKSAARPPGD